MVMDELVKPVPKLSHRSDSASNPDMRCIQSIEVVNLTFLKYVRGAPAGALVFDAACRKLSHAVNYPPRPP
jgi:hypothetical protein